MEKRVSVAVDDPILAHTETVTSTNDLQPGDLLVAIDRAASYPPGYRVPLYQMTLGGLTNLETALPDELPAESGATLYRLKI